MSSWAYFIFWNTIKPSLNHPFDISVATLALFSYLFPFLTILPLGPPTFPASPWGISSGPSVLTWISLGRYSHREVSAAANSEALLHSPPGFILKHTLRSQQRVSQERLSFCFPSDHCWCTWFKEIVLNELCQFKIYWYMCHFFESYVCIYTHIGIERSWS